MERSAVGTKERSPNCKIITRACLPQGSLLPDGVDGLPNGLIFTPILESIICPLIQSLHVINKLHLPIYFRIFNQQASRSSDWISGVEFGWQVSSVYLLRYLRVNLLFLFAVFLLGANKFSQCTRLFMWLYLLSLVTFNFAGTICV